jgi:hypothetical protein
MNDQATIASRAQALAFLSLTAVLGRAPALRAQDEYRPSHSKIYLELAGNTTFGLTMAGRSRDARAFGSAPASCPRWESQRS